MYESLILKNATYHPLVPVTHWYKKWWVWVLIIGAVGAVVGVVMFMRARARKNREYEPLIH